MNEDGSSPKYSTQGHGEEWTDAPEAFFLEIKDGNTFYKDGNEWTDLTDDQKAAYIEKYGVNTKTVIWELGENYQLEDDVTYTVVFNIWPSQAAYDLVADLNNGIKVFEAGHDNSITDEERAQVIELTAPTATSRGTYSLRTNTSATVDYKSVKTVNGVVESESASAPITDPKKSMPLTDETISVEKLWHNYLDSRSDADIAGIELMLTADADKYMDLALPIRTTDGEGNVLSTSWRIDDIFIACGLIVDGEVKEPGHDYYVTEQAESASNDTAGYWEVRSDVYRPMVINTTHAFLIKKDTRPSGTEGEDYYVIDGKYYVEEPSAGTMIAVNERLSWLNLVKRVQDLSSDHSANPDEFFTYTITMDQANGNDIYFTVYGDDLAYMSGLNAKTVDGDYRYGEPKTSAEEIQLTDGGVTRTYYRAGDNTPFTLSIKADWSVRFLNLSTGTPYTIVEADNADGFEFVSATTVETLYSGKTEEGRVVAEGYPKTTQSRNVTVEGTINQRNTDYTVTYLNKYEPRDTLTVTKQWVSDSFAAAHGDIAVALFRDADGDGLITSVDYIEDTLRTISTEAGAADTSVTYNNIGSLDTVVVREVTVTEVTEGEGEDAVTTTTVTPVDEGGRLEVSGEMTFGGTESANHYTVTYSQGTAAEGARTDTVTNTPVMTPIELTKIGDWTVDTTLSGVQFRLYSDAECTEELLKDSAGNDIGQEGVITTGTDGRASVGTFMQGTYYLKEVKAADGYYMLTDAIAFTVNADGSVAYSTENANFDATHGAQYGDEEVIGFYISNPSGYVLPSTGGFGADALKYLGLGLILLSWVGLMVKKRRA